MDPSRNRFMPLQTMACTGISDDTLHNMPGLLGEGEAKHECIETPIDITLRGDIHFVCGINTPFTRAHSSVVLAKDIKLGDSIFEHDVIKIAYPSNDVDLYTLHNKDGSRVMPVLV